MFTGRTAVTGLATTLATLSPWPITAMQIAMGIRKRIPPMSVVLMVFSMVQFFLVVILEAQRRDRATDTCAAVS
jgi:hypothetical protein